jgi:DNA-binding MarR family transcriptional regulator
MRLAARRRVDRRKIRSAMRVEAPLPALLSQAFVAFTIEVDNEAERVVAHMTTSFGSRGERRSVWLTSLAMWFNCLRGLADAGELTVAGLQRQVRMTTNLDGMRRWGYITIDGVGRVARGTPRPHARPGSVLALTGRGAEAEAIWRPLPAEVERRWRERFGDGAIDQLRTALLKVSREIEAPLPDFMPIGRVGGEVAPGAEPRSRRERDGDVELPLVSLIARVLIVWTRDHEGEARLPLPVWCNLVRVLDTDTPVAVRELPGLTGVSKEALAVLIGRMEKAQCVIVEPRPGGRRGQQVQLTAERGARARAGGRRRLEETHRLWETRYGVEAVAALRAALEPIVGDGTRSGSPLFAGLTPPPGGWRSQTRPAQLLPWYPMVSHRGGYPDGS